MSTPDPDISAQAQTAPATDVSVKPTRTYGFVLTFEPIGDPGEMCEGDNCFMQ